MESNNNHKDANHIESDLAGVTPGVMLSSVQPTGACNDEEPLGCASVSNSYCLEWERLFMRVDYLMGLRSLAINGSLRSCRFRSICWKLFLEVLPENQLQWLEKTRIWRKQYDSLKNQLIFNPRDAEAKDLSINNPLSQEVESPWNQFFLDNELRLTIKQDVIRTYPKIEFYHTDGVRTMMVDILFIYAKLKPETSYRQFGADSGYVYDSREEVDTGLRAVLIIFQTEIGFFNDTTLHTLMTDILFCYARSNNRIEYKQGMHELLAPLIFILHCDQQAFLHACEMESVNYLMPAQSDVTRQLLDPKYLEHDAYAMFSQIMETVEPWYVSKEIIPTIQRDTVLTAQPFVRPPELHPSNVIVTKLTRIQDYVLKRFDPELHEFLQTMDIVPQIYGIRWVRLLFGREFPMQDLLMLWDAIFADSISFDLVDYVFVAMLLYIRDAMLASDYASCLHLLMKYPPVADIQFFINKALYLREPSAHPKPIDCKFQKPGSIGGNGVNSHALITKRGGGSLGSSVTQGLSFMSGQRRPESLVIGGTGQMSKSTSEPMNLITDSIQSPSEQDAAGLPENDRCNRKGSTASLSHIESVLAHNSRSTVSVRPNMSSQNLSQFDSSGVEQMSLMSGATESATSPTASTSRTGGKFFMFGGARGARKTANKQRTPQKTTTEADIARVMTSVSSLDTMCRRCATDLDVHIGTLQKHLLKQDIQCDDEVLLALAGIKQVRDVLKGVLKPACLSDNETDSVVGGSSYSGSIGLRRQLSGDGSTVSAQSSQSTTPVLGDFRDSKGRYFIATPDLLSSDTDVNSPADDSLLPPLVTSFARNPSNDTITPAQSSEYNNPPGESRLAPASDRYLANEGQIDTNLPVGGDDVSSSSDHCNNSQPNLAMASRQKFELFGYGNSDSDNKTLARFDQKGPGATQQKATNQQSTIDSSQASHDRESSPMNRIASIFRNFPKF